MFGDGKENNLSRAATLKRLTGSLLGICIERVAVFFMHG
jgi:hypothetical protein